MEPIQVYNESTGKEITVFVSREVAEKCRTDESYAKDLYSQILEQEIDDGSTIEIETEVLEPKREPDMEKGDNRRGQDTWTKKEVLKLLKLYQQCRKKFGSVRKRPAWSFISKELAKSNVRRNPEQCAIKWKNLIKTYKKTLGTQHRSEFTFFNEMDCIVKNIEFEIPETSYEDATTNVKDEPETNETWSNSDIQKLLSVLKIFDNIRHSSDIEFWEKVSNELSEEENVSKSAVQCSSKWSNLLKNYNSYKTGNLKQTFSFCKEMEEIFNKSRYEENNGTFHDDGSIATTEESMDDADELFEFDNSYTDQDDCDISNEEVESPLRNTTWTEEETFKLISAYKKLQHQHHKYRMKNVFWNLIAAEMKKDCANNKDGEKCKAKWYSLVNSYTNNKNWKNKVNFPFADAMKDVFINENSSEDDQGKEKTKWTTAESSNLLKIYSTYKDKFTELSADSLWQQISKELNQKGVQESPESCRNQWEKLLSTYYTHKALNLNNTSFPFINVIENILGYDDDANSSCKEVEEVCQCEKQVKLTKLKKHEERMEMLKRKLDIEDRKVSAFEKYLKMLNTNNDDIA